MGLDNPLHIAFLLIIALMVFGAKRLPEMGRSLGTGLRGFKDALNPDTSSAPDTVHAIEAAEPAAVERSAVERSAVEPPAVERAAVEPPAVERSAVERSGQERAAA
jgi:sec-independent protein translocase protein TatA